MSAAPRRSTWTSWLTWLLLLGIATLVMVSARARLGQAHVALTYLLVVLGASARGGRALGLTIAVAAFLLFDAFFLRPFATLVVTDPLDWLVLVAFLVTSVAGAQLLYLAREAERVESLRESDRMKDALLASVSHDLRTPLTTIKALAHGIRIDGDERAEIIEAETDRLTRLVADMLDFSRLQGGALRLDVQLTAADELLESLGQAMAGVPGADRVRMSLDPHEPLLVGRFDLVHSARVLANLVTNALAHGGSDTPVEVSARRDGEWLAFSVADRGPGVPDSERERIFEPFQRGAGTSPDARGAGLGLSIARRLAEAQQGSLRFAPREGGGSEFTLRLPAADIGDRTRSL